jgi:hypothetical protein
MNRAENGNARTQQSDLGRTCLRAWQFRGEPHDDRDPERDRADPQSNQHVPHPKQRCRPGNARPPTLV